MSAFCRFVDSFGFEWQAYEVAVPKPAPKHERTVLYFFSRGETRVLSDYPRNWEQSTWAELEDLCAKGRSVHRDGPMGLHPELRRTAV